MRAVASICLALMLLVPLLAGAAASVSASETESIDIIVPLTSSATQLSGHQLEALFTRAQTRWNDGTPVIPLNYPNGHSLRMHFDQVVLRLSPDQVGRFWLDRRIRGLGMPPKQVSDVGLLLKVVAHLPGAIGYVPTARNDGSVKVVARVARGRVTAP